MRTWTFLPLVTSLLVACDNTPPIKTAVEADNTQSSAELQALIRQVKNNLVFVDGGDFLMGDLGKEYGPEKIQLDTEKYSKPLHKVKLTSYSISKFKTTNQEYKIYLKMNGLQLKKPELTRPKRFRLFE